MQIKNSGRSKGVDRSRPALKHRATEGVPAKEAQRAALFACHEGQGRWTAETAGAGAGVSSLVRIILLKRITPPLRAIERF